MGIRNVWIYGKAYSTSGQVTVRVLNTKDEVVFDGPVSTVPEEMPTKPAEYEKMMTWEIDDETPLDIDTVGIMKITPTNGGVTITTTGSDKYEPDDFSIVHENDYFLTKSNATIDGVPIGQQPGDEFVGALVFSVPANSTLIVDMNLNKLRYPVPGYLYPLEENAPDYYNGDGSAGSGQRNRPHWDPLKAGKMIPSYIPEYSSDPDVNIPINIPDPVDAPTNRSVFRNDGPIKPTKIIVSMDFDNDNEPDIVFTNDHTGVSIQVDDDVNVNLTITEQGNTSSLEIDIDNNAEPDIIITKNADGTYNVNVDDDLDVQIDVDIT